MYTIEGSLVSCVVVDTKTREYLASATAEDSSIAKLTEAMATALASATLLMETEEALAKTSEVASSTAIEE